MAFTTAPAAGAKLRAATLSALISELRPIRAALTSTQALATSDITPENITGLVVPLAANTRYSGLVVVGAILSAGTTEDLRMAATWPTGATVCGWTLNLDTTATSVAGSAEMVHRGTLTSGSAITFVGLNATTATFSHIWLDITNGANAGNLQIQAAQVSSGGNTVTIQAGSFIELRQAS